MEFASVRHGVLSALSGIQGTPVIRWFLFQWVAVCVVVALSACSDHQQLGPQADARNLPDWVRAEEGPPLRALVGITPEERTGHPMDPLPEGVHWRLWRYEVPGIKQLSQPRGQPMDIALIAIDARITAIKHRAFCRQDDCAPITPEFPAIAILVASPGSFEAAGLKLGSRVEYGQPNKREPDELIPLR